MKERKEFYSRIIGLGKLAFNRSREHFAFGQFGILLYLLVKDIGWHWWYLFLIPVYLAFLIFVDFKYIYPAELKASFDLNERLTKIYAIVNGAEKEQKLSKS